MIHEDYLKQKNINDQRNKVLLKIYLSQNMIVIISVFFIKTSINCLKLLNYPLLYPKININQTKNFNLKIKHIFIANF